MNNTKPSPTVCLLVCLMWLAGSFVTHNMLLAGMALIIANIYFCTALILRRIGMRTTHIHVLSFDDDEEPEEASDEPLKSE